MIVEKDERLVGVVPQVHVGDPPPSPEVRSGAPAWRSHPAIMPDRSASVRLCSCPAPRHPGARYYRVQVRFGAPEPCGSCPAQVGGLGCEPAHVLAEQHRPPLAPLLLRQLPGGSASHSKRARNPHRAARLLFGLGLADQLGLAESPSSFVDHDRVGAASKPDRNQCDGIVPGTERDAEEVDVGGWLRSSAEHIGSSREA